MTDVLDVVAARGVAPGAPLVVASSVQGGGLEALTLGELRERVGRRAEALAAEGVSPGRVQPLKVEADLAGVETLLALWRLGAVPAPLNARLTPAEVAAAHEALEGRAAPGAQVVLWTSGTSGRPRGVSISWEGLVASVEAARTRLALAGPRDVWLASLSPGHVGGLVLVVRALLLGSPLVAPGPADGAALGALLDGEGIPPGVGPVTHLSLVPTQLLRAMEARGDRPAPPHLCCVLVGGAHMPRALLERARATGWPVALTYGATETTSQVATAPPDLVRRKPGSVGRPLDGVEVRLDEGGEILVRGPTLALGTVAGEGLTDADGWYRTGDLGRLDAHGHLWFTGRRADRVVSGGVTVDALEVEEALRRHPAVADAAVAGVPDEEWGERLGACVVPVEGECDLDEVGAWLAVRLSSAKRPRLWHVVDTLPRNANGKVDREAVRRLLARIR